MTIVRTGPGFGAESAASLFTAVAGTATIDVGGKTDPGYAGAHCV